MAYVRPHSLRREMGRSALWFAVVAAPFVLFAIYPLLVVLKASFVPSDIAASHFTLKFYGKILTPRYLQEFYNTLIFASLNTLISLFVGTVLAIYLHQRKFRGSRVLSSLLIIPYIIPNYILVIAVIAFTGNNGLINMVLRWLLGNPDFILPLKVMHTYHGVLLVFIFHGIPLAAFIISAVLTSINKSYMEAAVGLGASPLRAIVRVILPLQLVACISSEVGTFNNFNLAAALSLFIIVIIFVVDFVIKKITGASWQEKLSM